MQRQRLEIDAYNRQCAAEGVDFRLLQGTEAEILADGTLGLSDEVLATLDVVVASIHSAQRQDRETITERCLKAVRNPHVDILGHPTGRLLGHRPPTELDMERVLQACRETGTVVEINANPERLDVNDVYARRAVELGCKLAINCDAHRLNGGVRTAPPEPSTSSANVAIHALLTHKKNGNRIAKIAPAHVMLAGVRPRRR